MKLGEKLKLILDEMNRAKVEGLLAQHNADMEKIRKERTDIEDWIKHVTEKMVSQINAGKVPLVVLKNYDRQQWVRKAKLSNAEHQDIWNDFRQFWHSEGLDPIISEDHDGMGMESWINITVKVLPNKPRSHIGNSS
jgi:hypothetical protein